MRQWSRPIAPEFDEVHDFDPPCLTFDVSDNPVIAELLGPDGEVLRQWVEREPIGFKAERWRDAEGR